MLPSSIWISYFTGIGDLYLELVTLRSLVYYQLYNTVLKLVGK